MRLPDISVAGKDAQTARRKNNMAERFKIEYDSVEQMYSLTDFGQETATIIVVPKEQLEALLQAYCQIERKMLI